MTRGTSSRSVGCLSYIGGGTHRREPLQSGLWRKAKHIVVHHFAFIFVVWMGTFLVRMRMR